MISYLKGNIIETDERSAIIVSGNTGWRVFLGPNTLDKVQKNSSNVNVFTHLYGRENSQELYGFLNFKELKFFELLLGVSGVGPKHAQLIMDSFLPEELAGVIQKEKSEFFTRVPGIGTKTAKKIIIDLKPKIKLLGIPGEIDEKTFSQENDVIEALKSLGYNHRQAKEALKKISKDTTGLSKMVEEALKILGTSR